MKPTELPGPLRAAVEAVALFERGEIDIETLQGVIRMAEDSVTEHDLRDLRRYLESAEGNLERIRFTLEGERQTSEALRTAHGVRDCLRDVFSVGGEPPVD